MTVMMVMMTDVYDEMHLCIRYPILSTQNEVVWWRVKLDDRETGCKIVDWIPLAPDGFHESYEPFSCF
jgi:hypothetical protein